ncbi:MAG: LptF/LptG family permease [Vampirovibrionales bacterium]
MSFSLFSALFFTRLDRYIFQRTLLWILTTIGVFTLVWIAPETLFKILQYGNNGTMTWEAAWQLLIANVPIIAQQTVPLSVMLGSVLLFQKLQQDQEWTAFQIAGISPRRLLLPALGAGFCISLLQWSLQETLIPWGGNTVERIEQHYGIAQKEARSFVFFDRDPVTQELERTVFIENLQRMPETRSMVLKFYARANEPGFLPLIHTLHWGSTLAWTSTKTHQTEWCMKEGRVVTLNTIGFQESQKPFKAHCENEKNDALPQLIHLLRQNPDTLGGKTLWDLVQAMKQTGQTYDMPFFQVKLWQRIVNPLACWVFILVGYWLSQQRPRQQKHWGLVWCASTLFLYIIFQTFCHQLGIEGQIPAGLATFLPLIGAACIAYGIKWLEAYIAS